MDLDKQANTSISIHALCERATFAPKCKPAEQYISIHALCERATDVRRPQADRLKFLSTPSARGRPRWAGATRTTTRNFYPRPLREGDCGRVEPWRLARNFYPRPLREGDPSYFRGRGYITHFYPRPLREGDLILIL